MVFPTEQDRPPHIQQVISSKQEFEALVRDNLHLFQARKISASFLLDELTRDQTEADAMLFADSPGTFNESLLIARRTMNETQSAAEIQIHAPFSSPPEIQDLSGNLAGEAYPSVTLGSRRGVLMPTILRIHDTEHGRFVIATWDTPRIRLAKQLVDRFQRAQVIDNV